MSEVRVSVEWIFRDVVNYFKFLDCKKDLKLCLRAVSKMYISCALMHNAQGMFIWLNNVRVFSDLSPNYPRVLSVTDKEDVTSILYFINNFVGEENMWGQLLRFFKLCVSSKFPKLPTVLFKGYFQMIT